VDLFTLAAKGGWLMIFIFLSSVVVIFIIVERYLVLRKAQVDVGQFMIKLRNIYRKGNLVEVLDYCSQTNAPIANIIKKGIAKHNEGAEKVREAVESAGKAEIYHLEKRLGLLASVAGIAPLLGFLGTVTGMIAAFRKIEVLGGVASPADLAGGIWEALLTTAFGLIVGIPAYAFYNYFVTRVQRFVYEMEISTTEFLDLVEQGSDTNTQKGKL
jgi:biopolymer transport protein ExbB